MIAWLALCAGASPLTGTWTVTGSTSSEGLGDAVASAGDVNGDGHADVILGAANFDAGETNEGRAWVFHGSTGGLAAAPSWTAEPNQSNAWLGAVAGAGDVNGDGYDDVIVGASSW